MDITLLAVVVVEVTLQTLTQWEAAAVAVDKATLAAKQEHAQTKKDKMELIIQKTVELGVYEIVPVQMKRSVVKYTDEKKLRKKQERWQMIAEAAAKQCDRGIIPVVHETVSMDEAIDMARKLDYNMIPYELQDGIDKSREIVTYACEQNSVGIFIGPEGGFEPSEVEQAIACGIEPMTLGKRILRTETAGMALLSILMFQMQR